jgi:hypothetical protein
MKLSNIVSETEFRRVSELAPTNSMTQANIPSPTSSQPITTALGQQAQQNPQAQAKMMAQQALDRNNRKKQIQDQIKQTQEQLATLQKELATIK